jgi:hypothetical protein
MLGNGQRALRVAQPPFAMKKKGRPQAPSGLDEDAYLLGCGVTRR